MTEALRNADWQVLDQLTHGHADTDGIRDTLRAEYSEIVASVTRTPKVCTGHRQNARPE